MALRKIIEDGDPILRKKSRPVDEVTDRTKQIVEDMIETMKSANGVGLAAPQVGILRRIFVARPFEDEILCFINPEIISTKGEQDSTEGCLSVPGYVGLVKRPMEVTIRGLNKDGVEQERTFDEFAATVMCHEYDHLDGILYKDKAKEMYEAGEEE